MFFGEYEHTIDDKNRLTLPARFRDALAGGVVLTRGLDACLDVFARPDWDALVEARLAPLDPFSKEARELKRFFFSAASDAELDKQGRVLVPPALHRHAQARARGRRGGRSRPPRDLGSRRSGQTTSPRSKGVQTMLPNVLQRSASDHVPVLAEEVRELLAVRPGETVVDATFGAGGHSSLLMSDLEGDGKLIAIDRDPSARAYFDRFKAGKTVQARFLRGEFSLVLSQLAANDVQADAILLDLGVSSMQLDRPERGFSYAADAPLDMRMDTAAELSARELVNEADERELGADLPPLRRGALRAPDRTGDRPPPRRAAVRAHDRPRRHDQAGDPDTGPLRRRPSRQARLPGAADRGQRRARRARSSAPGGGADAPARRPHRRHQLPLARGPDRQAVLPRAGARLHVSAGVPDLQLRQGAGAARPDAQAGPSGRARAGGEPARGLREAPRGREGESLMASWAGTARVEEAPVTRTRPRRRPVARTAPRARPFGGVVWIVVVAVLLAGVVAVNVAVLQLNVRLDELGRERIQLRADTNRLSSQLSSASANARIESQARSRLGLVRADPALTEHVQLAPPKP